VGSSARRFSPRPGDRSHRFYASAKDWNYSAVQAVLRNERKVLHVRQKDLRTHDLLDQCYNSERGDAMSRLPSGAKLGFWIVSELPRYSPNGWGLLTACGKQPESDHCKYPPGTPPGFRLLQAKFFSRRQQCDRFANTPLARFRSFSRMNPNDEVTSVGGRQLPKELPHFGICLQRFGDVER